MFDADEFVASCIATLEEPLPQIAIKELMLRTMERPGEVEAALGTPTMGGITTLHHSPELTVLNIIWTPGMSLGPHDHRMWAVIGLYGGQEDNRFYRRTPQGLATARGKELRAEDALVLGEDVIHAVSNPGRTFTGAVHVYGGDFFAAKRTSWDPVTLEEQPWDIASTRRVFTEANERYAAERADRG